MRRIDRKLNMKKVNLLSEQRYLNNKGLITEGDGSDFKKALLAGPWEFQDFLFNIEEFNKYKTPELGYLETLFDIPLNVWNKVLNRNDNEATIEKMNDYFEPYTIGLYFNESHPKSGGYYDNLHNTDFVTVAQWI